MQGWAQQLGCSSGLEGWTLLSHLHSACLAYPRFPAASSILLGASAEAPYPALFWLHQNMWFVIPNLKQYAVTAVYGWFRQPVFLFSGTTGNPHPISVVDIGWVPYVATENKSTANPCGAPFLNGSAGSDPRSSEQMLEQISASDLCAWQVYCPVRLCNCSHTGGCHCMTPVACAWQRYCPAAIADAQMACRCPALVALLLSAPISLGAVGMEQPGVHGGLQVQRTISCDYACAAGCAVICECTCLRRKDVVLAQHEFICLCMRVR